MPPAENSNFITIPRACTEPSSEDLRLAEVLPAGIEPTSKDPESFVLSIELREHAKAEGTGFEPV